MPDPLFETFLTSQGLNGLCQKEYHILVKNWIFDDPFHKKLSVLVILVPVMIKSSGSGSVFGKLGFKGCWGQWGCRGHWGQWGWRGFSGLENHYCALQSLPDSSMILGLYFDVLNMIMFWQNHKNSYWILATFLSESDEAAWGQKSFKWLIRHKFPLLRNPLSISFW